MPVFFNSAVCWDFLASCLIVSAVSSNLLLSVMFLLFSAWMRAEEPALEKERFDPASLPPPELTVLPVLNVLAVSVSLRVLPPAKLPAPPAKLTVLPVLVVTASLCALGLVSLAKAVGTECIFISFCRLCWVSPAPVCLSALRPAAYIPFSISSRLHYFLI